MTDLVICLSSGDKSWAHAAKLIREGSWTAIFLITDDFGQKNFISSKDAEFIVVDFKKPVFQVIEDIRKHLQGKFTDLEVALNIVSGSGKEHMAILSALLKLGVGIRLVAVTSQGIKEL